MADTKITDLTALTGANLASGDDLALVDVSDTSMAASGTDKKITANELRIGLATTLGVVGIDKIYDAIGDLPVGTAADVATKLSVGTTGGAALTADPNDSTYKMSWNYPISAREIFELPSGALAMTIPRVTLGSSMVNQSAANTNFQSGFLAFMAIGLTKGQTYTSITVRSGSTAGSAMTNQWFGLWDSSGNQLRLTSDDTSTAWAANTEKTLNLSSTYTATATGLAYVSVMVAGTVPTLWGIGATGKVPGGVVNGRDNTHTGLTNPASAPSPAQAPASWTTPNIWATWYAYLS